MLSDDLTDGDRADYLNNMVELYNHKGVSSLKVNYAMPMTEVM
jgi:hypothetical protein